MKNQQEKINEMTDRELRLNLYITQAIILLISVILAYWLFDNVSEFLIIWKWEPISILFWGGGAAACIVVIDFIAMKLLPERWFDDGGINDRMFRGISVPQLMFVTALIGFGEELLFRGILQTKFGLLFASIVFALLHVRYITKPFLFSFVLLISIAFGYLFEYTGNLLVTIFAHFLVDFIMGLSLRKDPEDGEVCRNL
ncbi:CPBP family intramembrane glutamic endopeptidase [Microbacteriaceae bacterium 4G12]